jgi:lysophospholipase L1-like esterase
MRGRWLLATVASLLAVLTVSVPVRAASVRLPNSMAAAGDSVTRAFNSTWNGCVLTDCPQYSWSTGDNASVESQYLRILARNPRINGRAYNDARTGAAMAALDGQLKAAAAQGAQYVTVLMGSNDLCTSSPSTMTPAATFQRQLDQALGDFFTADRRAHLYLSSLPNLFQLWSLLHNNQVAAATWAAFDICQSMLNQTNNDAQRQLVVAQEQADNNVLATECARAVSAGDDCHWDNLAGFKFNFAVSDISTIDYFHPNLAGQNAIAALTWSAGYWPGL